MRSLTYFSTESHPFTDQELEALHKQSAQSNSHTQITGMLLYKQGNFLQVIEGPSEAIGKLFAKLVNDPRHGGIVTVDDRLIDSREFPDWQMGFKDLKHLTADSMPGFENFADRFICDEFKKDSDRTHELLLYFANNG